MPHSGRGNEFRASWGKRLRRKPNSLGTGSDQEGKQTRGPQHKGISAAPKYRARVKSCSGGNGRGRAFDREGEDRCCGSAFWGQSPQVRYILPLGQSSIVDQLVFGMLNSWGFGRERVRVKASLAVRRATRPRIVRSRPPPVLGVTPLPSGDSPHRCITGCIVVRR